jgi:hypothetical protein
MSEPISEVQFFDLTEFGFPGYRVGSDGTVWSCKIRRPAGSNWQQMKPSKNKRTGHLKVRLSGIQGEKQWQVHRLVALAFLGPPPPCTIVCHNDGCPVNNRLENLRYDSHSANQYDRAMHTGGYDVPAASKEDLTTNWPQLRERIITAFREGCTKYAIGRMFGVSPARVKEALELIAPERPFPKYQITPTIAPRIG